MATIPIRIWRWWHFIPFLWLAFRIGPYDVGYLGLRRRLTSVQRTLGSSKQIYSSAGRARGRLYGFVGWCMLALFCLPLLAVLLQDPAWTSIPVLAWIVQTVRPFTAPLSSRTLDLLGNLPQGWLGEELIPLLIAAGVFLPAMTLIMRGRQLSQPTAREALAGDSRKPVLYLRSFEDEGATVEVPGDPQTGTTYKVRLEPIIQNVFGRFGPFIAIGKPGEKLPQLGAARDYVSDDLWQEQVRKWINDASLIVIVAGLSRGLDWELERALSPEHRKKLVVIVPPTRPWPGEDELRVKRSRWSVVERRLEALPDLRGTLSLADESVPDLLAAHFPRSDVMVIINSSRQMGSQFRRALFVAAYGVLCNPRTQAKTNLPA